MEQVPWKDTTDRVRGLSAVPDSIIFTIERWAVRSFFYSVYDFCNRFSNRHSV
jgi:hypothetical protein